MFCLMNVQPSREQETIQHLPSGKAPDADAIPVVIYKAGGLPNAKKLTKLFHYMRRKEAIYSTNIQGCIHNSSVQTDNHRGWKDTSKILLNRLNMHFGQAGLTIESQRGFRKDIGTIYMNFTALQLQSVESSSLTFNCTLRFIRFTLMIHWLVRVSPNNLLNVWTPAEAESARLGPLNRFKPPSNLILLTVPRRYVWRLSLCCLFWYQFLYCFHLMCVDMILI